MDVGAKNRLKLWLRSERAFGLLAVAVPRSVGVFSAPVVGDAAPMAAVPAASRRVGAAPVPAPPPREIAPPSARRDRETASGGAAEARPTRTGPDRETASGGAAEARPVPSERVAPPIEFPALGHEEKVAQLAAMDRQEVSVCVNCRLCDTRTKTVFGEGNVDAQIMFIGEGPGMNEDRTGRPFVGRAGDFLDKMIAGMGLAREQVYIANIVKCRAWFAGPPPKDRAPAPDEVAACAPYLERQVQIIRPRVIVTLGLPAAKHVLQTESTMGRLRGNWHEWLGIKVMPTYHPSYVLRTYAQGSPEEVRKIREAVWSDLKKVLAELGMSVPQRGGQTSA